jgi:cobalt-zinc-cadmium efflux system outer membrane protein
MRSNRSALVRGLLLASIATMYGCVSSSISPDLAHVMRTSGAPVLPRIADDVDAEDDESVHALLATPLDAERAVRIALVNNRALRARLRELGIPRGLLLEAGLAPNPTFEVERMPERDTRLELAFEYDVTSLVLAPLRSRAARPALEAARYEVASFVVQLGYEVRTAFYDLAAATERLGIAQRSLDAQTASRDAAIALFEAGNTRSLDVAVETAAYERARVGVAQLELARADAEERVRRLLGLHGADAVFTIQATLDATPPALDVPDDLEAKAIEASLELAAMRHRAEGLALASGVARTEGWLPDISVDLHVLRGRPEQEPGVVADQRTRVGAGVTFTVPLFDRNQGRRRALDAEADGLVERYYGLAVDVRSAARDARNRFLSAQARVDHFERVLIPAQRRVLDETRLQYNAMQIAVFPLLDARRAVLDVELAYVDTLRERLAARAALAALLAGQRVDAPRPASSVSSSSSETEGGH